MGVHKTLNITRSKARQIVMETLIERINDDNFIESYINLILDERLLCNVHVVPDEWDADNDDDMI